MDVLKKLKTSLTSFEDACKIEGLDAKKVIPSFEFFPDRDIEAMRKFSELVIIIRAANRIANNGKEWIPEYGINTQDKHEPWFRLEGLGGSRGFRFLDCVSWASHSYVGYRLCFFSIEVENYVVETFLDNYKSFFVIESK